MDRRTFLAGAATMAGMSGLPGVTSAGGAKTRLILLGTGGGPRPREASSASAQVVIAGGTPYVIDCGDGVARQLVRAGIALDSLRHVFITHHHSDHNADYGNLIWLAWAAGLRTRVDAWGPPPLERMSRLFFEMNAYDIETRIANEGRVALAPLVHVHERTEGGLVMKDDNVTVTAALVDHPPVVPAFGYRIDGGDRSIVISGDTVRSERVVKLAQGADVLVHSALYVPAVGRMVDRVPPARRRKACPSGASSWTSSTRRSSACPPRWAEAWAWPSPSSPWSRVPAILVPALLTVIFLSRVAAGVSLYTLASGLVGLLQAMLVRRRAVRLAAA